MSEFLEDGIDFDRPNAARMYDYYLGGAHNFAVDRELADQVVTELPFTPFNARVNRSFLGHAVRWALDRGVTQFLDLGSGVPTVGNVHEIAHQRDPDARVAYVDFEPVAVAHADEIIKQLGTSTVTVTRADARDPPSVLRAPGVAGLLDFERPVALLAISVLHFVEGDVGELLARYRARLASSSVIAIAHASDDQTDPEITEQIRKVRQAYARSATPVVMRSRAELLAALDGLELAEPGLVDVTEWLELDASRRSWTYGAIGVVP